jgi:hypothetical protein
MTPRRDPPIDRYRDETVRIAPGDVRYTIDLDDDEVEKLAAGFTPRRVTERAYAMLEWKREAAQQWETYDDGRQSRQDPPQRRRKTV